jgi:excinuclease ABC subunit C
MKNRILQKIVVIGNNQSDRTGLVYQLFETPASSAPLHPNPMDFYTRMFDFNECEIKMVAWDLAGETRYSMVRKSCYAGAQAAIIVVDPTDTNVEQDVRNWLNEMKEEMLAASALLQFEKAARLRDEIHMLETLDERGELDTHVQPEVFFVDPKRGLAGLQRVLKLDAPPRTIEGVDIAHLGGTETVASLVQFIDGLPFKPNYRRFKIRDVQGVDDYASIREVIARRFQRMHDDGHIFPDLLLIDGGKGQLSAAAGVFDELGIAPPKMLALAKREEEVFLVGQDEPLTLSRHSFALRLLQYVRDEAHRFAQHYHHILRRKSMLGD